LSLPARLKPAARAFVGIFFTLVLVSLPTFAQDEGAAAPENTQIGWVFRWLNFAIVFGGIAYLLVKSAGPAFRARADAIQAAIAEGSRAREEAEQRRKEAEQKLAGIPQEIGTLRAHAKRDTDAETARIRDLARDEAAKMDRAAELEIAAAERAARLELKATAARLAIERAEAQLREQLTTPADSQLVRSFVGDLAERNN
jgi:F0F1-type ATP synthase membrane subunit b/b'